MASLHWHKAVKQLDLVARTVVEDPTPENIQLLWAAVLQFELWNDYAPKIRGHK